MSFSDLIFRTDRSQHGYNLTIFVNDDDKLVVGIDTGNTGHAIVLTDPEAEAFWAAMWDRQSKDTGAADKPETPSDGIPPHEPSSCGTAYLASERALRIIEHATKLGEAMSGDAIEQITNLAHEAGAACNRAALRRHAFADEIPF